MSTSILNIVKAGFILIIVLAITSCNDDKNNEDYYPIPDVYINRQINLDLPLYQDLNNPGTFLYLEDEGYKGVILYHDLSGEYIAFERCCPYKPLDSCSVLSVDNSLIYIKCGHYEGTDWIPCCDSKFEMNGNILEGPSTYPLLRYAVQRAGNILSIQN